MQHRIHSHSHHSFPFLSDSPRPFSSYALYLVRLFWSHVFRHIQYVPQYPMAPMPWVQTLLLYSNSWWWYSRWPRTRKPESSQSTTSATPCSQLYSCSSFSTLKRYDQTSEPPRTPYVLEQGFGLIEYCDSPVGLRCVTPLVLYFFSNNVFCSGIISFHITLHGVHWSTLWLRIVGWHLTFVDAPLRYLKI